ncbi:MAG: BMP family protein [Chloroflexi bacterium]|nr:BMP family protein [Chloroflexota bacterium]MBI5349180.1 BMP family protein [Chloroflexota bacterium]MBI5713895.1 BMP family protein [Chloroflexota bacterium]
MVEVTRIVAGTPVVEQKVVTATPAPPAPTAAPAQYKIAAVFPSSIKDAAFSQSMYEALLAVQKEMGGEARLKIAYSENMFQVPNAAAAIRDYASQGYNMVIAHGSQYGTSLAQIAPDFPKVSFAWGTSLDTFQSKGIGNVFAYQAEAQEGGYVQGVIAALMTKSNVVGVTGPVEAGDAKLYVDGFKKGVADTKKDVKVNVTYTGSFSDVTLMSAAAETHMKAGADILTGSSQSVVGSISVAKDKKGFWFGAQWDQSALAPEAVVASMVYDWTSVVKDMMTANKASVLGGKAYTLTFKNSGLKIVYNSKITVPADAKTKADAAIKGIGDGTLKALP